MPPTRKASLTYQNDVLLLHDITRAHVVRKDFGSENGNSTSSPLLSRACSVELFPFQIVIAFLDRKQ